MTPSNAWSESDEHAYRQLVAWCARIERRRRLVTARQDGASTVPPSSVSTAPSLAQALPPSPPTPTKVA